MTATFDRVLIVPRWAGSPTSDYYPWLSEQLHRHAGAGLEVRALAMPDPQTPRIDTWIPHLADALGHEPERLRRTLLVGHSVGCQAVLRALARLSLPEDVQVGGVLLVAAWFHVDQPWETLLPWMADDYDLARARRRTPWIQVLLSDNDPYTTDFNRTAAEFRTRVDAAVTVVSGAAHFNAAAEPAVLEAIVRRLS